MTLNPKEVTTTTKPAESKTPVIVKQRSASYWRVTLDNPPINLFDPEMIAGLQALVERLEQDDDVKVVVFDSADPDYFIAHLDLARAGEPDLKPGPTGLSPWPDVASRLELMRAGETAFGSTNQRDLTKRRNAHHDLRYDDTHLCTRRIELDRNLLRIRRRVRVADGE